jgi:branched-chain amino acid transport system substrate-binding protein
MTQEPTRRPAGVTRKQLVTGMGSATFGSLLLGGAAGFFGGQSAQGAESGGGTGKPVIVGALLPVTGPAAGDAQEQLRGLKLGAKQINDAGGIGGRPIEIQVQDAKDQAPNVMTAAMRKFVGDGVAAIFSPFLTYTNIETPIVGKSKIPLFHINTFQGNVDFAVKNGYDNLFQACPSETWYATGFTTVVDDLIKTGRFKPRQKTAAIVTSNDAYSSSVASTFRKDIEKTGWKVVQYDSYTAPQADWGGVLARIRKHDPDVVFQSDYLPGDEASFIKQFAQAPTRSLVYQLYAPSVPEYLDLAGKAADGVMWATTTGTIFDDDLGKRFFESYRKAYKQDPGRSNAGANYDMMRLWAQAASLASSPYAYEEVSANVRGQVFRGVNGAYKMGPKQLTCMPYPAAERDPSLGMVLQTYQIQNGKQVLISPDPYTTGSFQEPSWLR